MDISLVYFSQTGNTRKVTEAMAEAFQKKGHTARAIPLKKAVKEDIAGKDLLGIGTPCFANQAPTPVKDFLRGMPRLDGGKAFVFATSGGAPGLVLYDMTRLLRDKGAEVIGGFLSRGECFLPYPSLYGRFPGRPSQEELESARGFAASLAEHVELGRTYPLPESRPDALRRGWGFYDLVGVALKDPLLRLLGPKPKLDEDLCDQCQWCVKECPMDNISMHAYPVLGNRCIRCYRCLTGCPRGALHANWRFIDPIVAFLYSVTLERWFGDVERSEVP